MESAIESALREHGGIWLSRPADEDAGRHPGSADRELGDPSAPGDDPKDDRARYRRTNTAYAERIIEIVTADGAVWIQGDRWLLVAQILRDCGHRGPIGLLLDAPLPVECRLEASPWFGEVMAALHHLDLIGFHEPQWARDFEACRAGAARRGPRIGVFPSTAGSDEWVRSFLDQLGSAARRDRGPAE